MEISLVTGGAGFIGSHLVDKLIARGDHVIVLDNLSTGFEKNLCKSICSDQCSFINIDILNRELVKHIINVNKVISVYHFAANADVRGGINNLDIDLEQNVQGTCSVLWASYGSSVKKFIFASSAAVYGDPSQIPTPEESPLVQTSVYGASKVAAEMYIQGYSEYFNIQSFSFRLTSCLGERYSHGVVFDFVEKLKDNPKRLEILGDGQQIKSYLDVEDAIEAILWTTDGPGWTVKKKNTFNLGHIQTMTVTQVADIICSEMGLQDVEYFFCGGNKGWIGDSPKVLLDISKLSDLHWQPKISIEESIRKTVRYLIGV